MKVLIEVPDDYLNDIKEQKQTTMWRYAIANGKPLSDMTNGEVIIAMFPNLMVEIEGIHVTCWNDEHRWFAPDYDWWRSPYRVESEEIE